MPKYLWGIHRMWKHRLHSIVEEILGGLGEQTQVVAMCLLWLKRGHQSGSGGMLNVAFVQGLPGEQ
jgi:hypothetical protein